MIYSKIGNKNKNPKPTNPLHMTDMYIVNFSSLFGSYGLYINSV